jgi:hypothetical protein
MGGLIDNLIYGEMDLGRVFWAGWFGFMGWGRWYRVVILMMVVFNLEYTRFRREL